MDTNTTNVASQYNRLKGATWFPALYGMDVMIIGQGGIGSWMSLMLARAGCTIHAYDHDVYEEHNMSGQLVSRAAIGQDKTYAMSEMLKNLSPDTEFYGNGEYLDVTETNEIVICAVDTMTARKIAFKNWKEFVTGKGVNPAECFFQDGRLLPEYLQILNIPGNDQSLIERYEKDWLFDDKDIPELECTFKQTTHTAAMIASHMMGFFTNWAFNNLVEKSHVRSVPFMFEYSVPNNFTKSSA